MTPSPKNVVASILARLRNVAKEGNLSFNDILQSKLADVFGIDFGGEVAKPSHKTAAKKGEPVASRKAKTAKRVGKRSARGICGKKSMM